MAIVTECELRPNIGMARSLKDVADRLQTTVKALEVTPAEICRRTGIKPNALSQYLSGDSGRRITIAAAYAMRDEFRLTLDWIYDGDPSGLPDRLAAKLRKAKAA